MKHTEQWIWLPSDIYPDNITTVYSGFDESRPDSFTVAEFKKTYKFNKKVISADLRFCGDTVFQLYCNDLIVATGPACVGGDFIGNETPRTNYYSYEKSLTLQTDELNFFARVRMMPVQVFEYSQGRGGFMLSAILTFEDGTREHILTDESWLVRKNGAYTAPRRFDGSVPLDDFRHAEIVENIWNTETAPIPVMSEEEILPVGHKIELLPLEEKTVILELDKIWGGFVHVSAKTDGELYVSVLCREIDENGSLEEMVFSHDDEYRGFYMHSAGNLCVSLKNTSAEKSEVSVGFIKSHYPVSVEAETVTDDEGLNTVLKTCKHTLKICRQSHHLDSTRHCEPLACTGDYYVETLMTHFSFGDMKLAEFDILRTAVMLERENGRMFHTTYNLIWVRMLHDVYMATGNIELLERCKKALELLLHRFEGYVGENGLIETPPDYMFVDWIYIDGISMHHPPKALGQSCLNMFYFGALTFAEKIYMHLNDDVSAGKCTEKRESLRKAINSLLYDSEKGMYFEGLNTPTDTDSSWKWLPQNVSKKYYMKHSNILAAYFGVCDDDTARILIRKVMSDEIESGCQPYFMHYLLEAVYRLGLRDRYTLQICERWKAPVKECTKGLVEGFIAPEPGYGFDHSHAWGGTPLYSLPKALMGFEILKPGMKEIVLSPSLLGLRFAKVELMTPYGKVVCEMSEGKDPIITYPKEINVVNRF